MENTAIDYVGVKEHTYTLEHPQVIEWTEFFKNRYQTQDFIHQFRSQNPVPNFNMATVVGSQWYRFSVFMPWLLCTAASRASHNIVRHYVVQGAFEELGMRDISSIHDQMFLTAVQKMGVTPELSQAWREYLPITQQLNSMQQQICNTRNDAEILGTLLGLEIPAEEIIETLFYALCHNDNLKPMLMEDQFFKMHMQIEQEHIRLAVANFLRFCKTDDDKSDFIRMFDKTLQYWHGFWQGLTAGIQAGNLSGIYEATA